MEAVGVQIDDTLGATGPQQSMRQLAHRTFSNLLAAAYAVGGRAGIVAARMKVDDAVGTARPEERVIAVGSDRSTVADLTCTIRRIGLGIGGESGWIEIHDAAA